MRILITGAAGMIGTRLAAALGDRGELRGRPITDLYLHDLTPTDASGAGAAGPATTVLTGDLSDPDVGGELASLASDVVFHLAGVVSGEAEADLEKGYRVNVDGTRSLFDALRMADGEPRVVFTSSIAVYGAPFPPVIPDDFHLTPRTSYGTQKLIGEALLADYSRRRFFDGVGIRLPTITVRPGAPNRAASGFFSGIIREPLAGRRVGLPVDRAVRHPHASPESAVGFLLRAAELETDLLGGNRNLVMPSVSVTVAEQLAALERVAGAGVAGLVVDEPDPAIGAIVDTWPQAFDAGRARALGFRSEATFDDIVEAHLAVL